MESTELANVERGEEVDESSQRVLVRPVADAATLAEYFDQYEELCKKIVKDSDRQEMKIRRNGNAWEKKTFTKKSGWRKLGTAYGISIREARPETRKDREDGSFVIESHVLAFVRRREVEGVGKCDSREFGNDDKKLEHDVSAKAFTRACNRAIADFIGTGEVSAEEIEIEAQREQGPEKAELRGSGPAQPTTKQSGSGRSIKKDFPHRVADSSTEFFDLELSFGKLAEKYAGTIEWKRDGDHFVTGVIWRNLPSNDRSIDTRIDEIIRTIPGNLGARALQDRLG